MQELGPLDLDIRLLMCQGQLHGAAYKTALVGRARGFDNWHSMGEALIYLAVVAGNVALLCQLAQVINCISENGYSNLEATSLKGILIIKLMIFFLIKLIFKFVEGHCIKARKRWFVCLFNTIFFYITFH